MHDYTDELGYPTQELLDRIKNYTYEEMSALDFMVNVIKPCWMYDDWGFVLRKKYKGVRRLELHTGGWSGNEMIVNAILTNMWLTHFQMRYVMWRVGGHFYFEINCNGAQEETNTSS
jgi:hypothetical protein